MTSPQDAASPWPTPPQDAPVPGTMVTAPGTPATPVPAPTSAGRPAADQDHKLTVLGEFKRSGQWVVPAHSVHNIGLGEVRLDLRDAILSDPVTTIEIRGMFGQARIIVPDSYHVECEGSVVLGEFELRDAGEVGPPQPGAPTIRVLGYAVMSEVRVYRTSAPAGEGPFSVDGITGWKHRRHRRRHL